MEKSVILLKIADIIHRVCNIPHEKMSPRSDVINDLGMDSIDLLDVGHAIDRTFKIKLAVGHDWLDDVDGGSRSADSFVIDRIADRVVILMLSGSKRLPARRPEKHGKASTQGSKRVKARK